MSAEATQLKYALRSQPGIGGRLWQRIKKTLPRFSSRFHIAIGMSSLAGCICMLALLVGVIPDRHIQHAQTRAWLAQTMASLSWSLLHNGQAVVLRNTIDVLIDEHPSIHSVVLQRRSGGEYHFGADKPERLSRIDPVVVTDDISVPLMDGKRTWGELTVRYYARATLPWYQRYMESRWAIIGFIALLCFASYYLFLGRILKALDPSSAVPSRVRSALDTIAEALLVLDKKGHIVLVNSAFLDLTQISVKTLMGLDARELAWQDKQKFVWQQALCEGQTTRHDRICFTDAQQQVRTFLVNCSPIISAEDEVGGVLISMDDITLLEQQEQRLREAMDMAEQASQAKSTFLSNMSHEIRTPMTAILGFTEIMRRGSHQSDAERRQYLDTIAGSGEHLLALINDVLDLSKVESGAMEVEILPCSCAAVAGEVVRILESKAREKQIGIALDIATAIPDSIQTDPARLRQIITNLVGNAIKFTDQGKVSVQLSVAPLEPCSDNEALIRIAVIDSGIGMTPEQQSRVFDAFSQADASISRRFGGTGLGLSISRHLTEALGGTLELCSVPGEGSTFTVVLPFDKQTAALVEPECVMASLQEQHSESSSRWTINPGRILVVDDGPENRQLMSIVLSDLGMDVVLAENGKEGVETLFRESERCPFDLVFMDIQMPVMDGYEAVRLMRERGVTLPIVALTANAMKGFEHSVLNAGYSHYMPKPIDFDALGALLAELLGGDRQFVSEQVVVDNSNQFSAPLPMASERHRDGSRFGLALVSTLAASDSRFLPIVAKFKKRLEQRHHDLTVSVAQQLWGEVSQWGHWLKGSAGSVGLEPLSVQGRLLEQAAQRGQSEECLKIAAVIAEMQAAIVVDEAAGDEAAVTPSMATQPTQTDNNSPIYSALPVNNPDFYAVVALFMQRLDQQMQVFAEAVDTNNRQKISELAHWLSGSAGNVGYTQYKPLCEHMQQCAKQPTASMDTAYQAIEQLNDQVRRGWALTPRPDNGQ